MRTVVSPASWQYILATYCTFFHQHRPEEIRESEPSPRSSFCWGSWCPTGTATRSEMRQQQPVQPLQGRTHSRLQGNGSPAPQLNHRPKANNHRLCPGNSTAVTSTKCGIRNSDVGEYPEHMKLNWGFACLYFCPEIPKILNLGK